MGNMADQPAARLSGKVKAYEARYAKWQRDQEAFIAEHGLEAWDAKVEREIKVLYPEEEQL